MRESERVVSSIEREEVQHFLDTTAELLCQAAFTGQKGSGLLVSPTAGRSFGYAGIRDLAVAVSVLCDVGALDAARPLATFLLHVQLPDGSWPERVTPDGVPLGGPRAEDCTALAIWALLLYGRASGDEQFIEGVRQAVDRATQYTVERTLNPYLYLVETTSSLHEGQSSQGYDLWNNCAHAAAFALAHRVYGGERFRRMALLIRRAIGLFMTQESRFLRRLDASGYPDPRPDIALLSPYYFGLWTPSERTVVNSAELIERTLWNVEIGGYIRFLPYSPVERTVLPGPWPRYTAWMAQFHYDLGNRDRAEVVLRWLFNNRENGLLPQVLVPFASAHRYLGERRLAIRSALTGRAGADQNGSALLQRQALAELEEVERLAVEREVIPVGVANVWTHLETVRALKRGGYIERWEGRSTARACHD